MRSGYSLAQIVLHWVVVVLVALQFLVADGMADAFETLEETGAAEPSVWSNLHIAGGVTIFVLMLVRLFLRNSRGTPPPPVDEAPLMRNAAQAVHWAFYALLVLLPLSGAIAWFRGNDSAAEVHEVLKVVLLVLIGLHIAAAVYHHFVLKSPLLSRMTRPES